jgi:hypothetical protein
MEVTGMGPSEAEDKLKEQSAEEDMVMETGRGDVAAGGVPSPVRGIALSETTSSHSVKL